MQNAVLYRENETLLVVSGCFWHAQGCKTLIRPQLLAFISKKKAGTITVSTHLS